ncbi:hypothetical protein [Streptomyces sp. NPDC001020]
MKRTPRFLGFRPSSRPSPARPLVRADVAAGRSPDGASFTGGPTGVVPLSPGQPMLLATELPGTRRALIIWVRDLETGRMFAAHAMRALVTVVRG